MPNRSLLHTFLLLAATVGVYIWVTTPILQGWTLQLVGFLILTYAGTHWLKTKKPTSRNHVTLDLTLLTSIILLLVAETGALSSPFFFLLYFLLFAVSMLYEIETTMILTGVLVLFFLSLPTTDYADLTQLSGLLALVMITPLAIYTGHQYEQAIDLRRRAHDLAKHIGQQETDTLIFLSLNLKKTLISALDTLSLAVPQVKVTKLRTDLNVLYQDLRNLYRSADELQQLVDRETDEKK